MSVTNWTLGLQIMVLVQSKDIIEHRKQFTMERKSMPVNTLHFKVIIVGWGNTTTFSVNQVGSVSICVLHIATHLIRVRFEFLPRTKLVNHTFSNNWSLHQAWKQQHFQFVPHYSNKLFHRAKTNLCFYVRPPIKGFDISSWITSSQDLISSNP